MSPLLLQNKGGLLLPPKHATTGANTVNLLRNMCCFGKQQTARLLLRRNQAVMVGRVGQPLEVSVSWWAHTLRA